MPSRTIKGSPQRSAGAAWTEVETMVLETLAPASAVDDEEVRGALAALEGLGPMLVSAGVLADQPLVLRALPLQLQINVSLGAAALSGDERLGKVPGAASATAFGLYVPDPEPYRAEVGAAAERHPSLQAGPAPAELQTADATAATGFSVDTEALRRLSRGAR